MVIDNPITVRMILQNGGKYEGYKFPLVYEFISNDNKRHFAVYAKNKHDDMDATPFVIGYTCLMANGILTQSGEIFVSHSKKNVVHETNIITGEERTRLTYVELGNIMLHEVGETACLLGYGTKDPEWVGRYALSYKDINEDGTLN